MRTQGPADTGQYSEPDPGAVLTGIPHEVVLQGRAERYWLYTARVPVHP